MATYRTVHLSFWTDPKVDDDFTPEDKYFYLYLLTNPHTNLCGCYEISMKQMVRETGYSIDTVERLLNRMECVHDVIRFDRNTKEIYVLRWGKYNWVDSEKTLIGVRKQAESIKSEAFRKDILDRVCMGYPYPMQPSVTVTDTDTDTTADTSVVRFEEKKQKRFVPPTVDEVRAYCSERKNGINPEAFVDYYQARGWELKKGQKVKDWKACVRTWERNSRNSNSQDSSVRFALEHKGSNAEVFDDIFGGRA